MYLRTQMGLQHWVIHNPNALGLSSALSIASKLAASQGR